MTHVHPSQTRPLKTSFSATVGSLLLSLLVLTMLVLPLSAHAAATQPDLKTAKSFAALAAASVTNTGPTKIVGNIGTQSNAPTSVTGFPPGVVVGTIHQGDPIAVQAHADAALAYGTAKGETCPSSNNLTGQDLGGKTLTAGVYCFSSSAQLTGQLTLSGPGVFIFQTGSKLTTASDSSVVLTNGASACNVFWQIGSSATLGLRTKFIGNVLAQTSITDTLGGSSVGILFARDASVTLDTDSIVALPLC